MARPFDNLVELAAIKPDTSAGWTVVDFDSGSFRHLQVGIASGAFHRTNSGKKRKTELEFVFRKDKRHFRAEAGFR
jgi:hypothetical protein